MKRSLQHTFNQVFNKKIDKPQPTKSAKVEVTDYKKEGSFFELTINGDKMLAIVYKHTEIEGKSYVLLGTYDKESLKISVATDESPKLILILTEVVDGKLEVVTPRTHDNHELISITLMDLAKSSDKTDEYTETLLKASLVSCISSDMSSTYMRNKAQKDAE